VSTGSGGTYASSGMLTYPYPNLATKVSWFYYSAFLHWLGDFAFKGNFTAAAGVSGVCFNSGNSNAIVVWSPTSANTFLPNVKVDLTSTCPISGSSVYLVVPTDQQPIGVVTEFPVSGGSVTVTVSETPIIIIGM